MNVEIWKDIPGYEGKYQASTLGRIKSLPKKVACRGGYRTTTERIMKIHEKYRGGSPCYLSVDLGKGNSHTIHRLVAITFLPNPKNLPQINHKDGNKWNNRLENLEWCTGSENMQHAYKIGLQTPKQPLFRYKRKVISISNNGAIKEWNSKIECA